MEEEHVSRADLWLDEECESVNHIFGVKNKWVEGNKKEIRRNKKEIKNIENYARACMFFIYLHESWK